MIKRPKFVNQGPNHYAYVTIVGDGALADLVSIIGLHPDEGWDRADLRTRGRRIGEPYGFSRWSMYSGLPRGAPVDDHIGLVLDRLASVEASFAHLGPGWTSYISITGAFDDSGMPICISVKNHCRAAGFCLDYDFDFYFDGM